MDDIDQIAHLITKTDATLVIIVAYITFNELRRLFK